MDLCEQTLATSRYVINARAVTNYINVVHLFFLTAFVIRLLTFFSQILTHVTGIRLSLIFEIGAKKQQVWLQSGVHE